MNDETIKLTGNIQKEFERLSKKDKEFQTLLKATLENSKSYTDALNLADRLGANLSEAVKKNIAEGILPDDILSKEIADDIVNSVYGNAFDIAEQAAQNVQKRINESAGLGLNTVSPQTKQERLASLSNTVADKNINEAGKTLTKAARELPQGAVSDTLKANADFQGKSGINARIIRRAESKCCKWCDSLAGSYKYPDVPRDVYRRHANCRCTVEYYPGKGKEKQNVWSKEWKTQEEYDKIETIKKSGIVSTNTETPEERERRVKVKNGLGLADRIAEHPKMLGAYTPESLKKALEEDGCEVKPLGRGGLKGISFENGGGFKVNFGGNGILQYHPEKGSHHGGAYYKTSTGKGGTHRYELDGTEKRDVSQDK